MNEDEIIEELRDPDAVDVDGSPAPYRCWLEGLERDIAAAIREYPNQDAPQWLAPSAVLGVVERHLIAARASRA